MITPKEALDIILANISPYKITEVSVLDSLNYVLAEDVIAPDSLPRFNQAAMDGYAIKCADTNVKGETVKLKVVDKISAGDNRNLILNKGEAIEISTGAAIPNGSDAVVEYEGTIREGEYIFINAQIPPYHNIRKAGEDIKKGEVVLTKNIVINPAIIGLLGALGILKVKVYAAPEIYIFTTGNEIVAPEEEPSKYQIRDSNLWSMIASLRLLGFNPSKTFRFKDSKGEIVNFLSKNNAMPDMVIICGGISVGKYDYVKEDLKDFGVNQLFWKVSQKPGKPFYAGIKDKSLFFGLPGNPAAAIICFFMYIKPAIKKFMGKVDFCNNFKDAILAQDLKCDNKRTTFIRAFYQGEEVIPLTHQDSHMFRSFIKANSLIILEPRESLFYKSGEKVQICYLYG
jgi:molybdopterin molybdotransferase